MNTQQLVSMSSEVINIILLFTWCSAKTKTNRHKYEWSRMISIHSEECRFNLQRMILDIPRCSRSSRLLRQDLQHFEVFLVQDHNGELSYVVITNLNVVIASLKGHLSYRWKYFSLFNISDVPQTLRVHF